MSGIEQYKKHSGSEINSATGIGYMVIAMLVIPIVDGTAKFLSAEFSPLFISWSQYAVASALILPIGIYLYGLRVLQVQDFVPQIMRTLFLVAAMTLYHLAISKIPLTLALSAYFIGPLVTLLLSVLFLGERLSTIKLCALGLGFIGSLIILQPSGAPNEGILFAFGAGFFFALYLIATRMTAGKNEPFRTLVFQYVLGSIILFPQATFAWSMPGIEDLIFFLCLGLFAAVAHMLSIVAFRHAEASVLAPLIYVELIGSSIVGYLFFNEIPELRTIFGATFIIISGLLIIMEKRTN